MAFTLDPRIAQDSHKIGDTALCELRLMNHRHVPWFNLVPRREGITEIYQLSKADQQQLIHESCELGRLSMEHFKGDKLNIGAIGHVVPQLHIHHIVRYRNDHQWPKVFWGLLDELAPYSEKELQQRLNEVQSLFSAILVT